MRKRTLAREACLKILYQAEMTRREIHVAARYFWEEVAHKDNTVYHFSQKLTKGVEAFLEKIDEKISCYATNWQIKRMAAIDRNVLRLGVFELLYSQEVPPKVAINEAVELAKKYGDLESSKFVNGILDKIYKTERQQQEEKHEQAG